MEEFPLVSILIPNYNKAPYIRETLDSVLAQTYTNWECIIVDDHSTDESWNILEEYQAKDSRFKIFKRPDHLPKGGNACRNYAFELSKGKFIQWFDSDDILLDFALKVRIEEIERLESKDFVISHGLYVSAESLESENRCITPFFHDNFEKGFINIDAPYITQSVLYRKSFLQLNGIKWEERLITLQDLQYNFDCLISSNSYKILNSSIDWYWRRITDYSNVGGLGVKPESINSYNYLLDHFENKIVSGLNLNESIFILFKRFEKKSPSKLFSKFIKVQFYKNRISFSQTIIYYILFIVRKISKGKRYKFRTYRFELLLERIISLLGNHSYIPKYGKFSVQELNSKRTYYK